jgi:hypothetical protein
LSNRLVIEPLSDTQAYVREATRVKRWYLRALVHRVRGD